MNAETHIAKVVMLQSIAVVDVKIAIGNPTQNHIHPGEVVSSGGQFLPIVVTHIRIVFQPQQQRSGAAGWVGGVLYIGQSEAGKTAQQFRRT